MTHIESQKKSMRRYLKRGGKLTCLTGFKLFGCTKVNTRVSEFINKEHLPIDKKPITVTNRFGKQVRVMEYSMKRNKISV